MQTLHVFASLRSGYARKDGERASVVGAYTDKKVAEAVRKVSGMHAAVVSVEVNAIPSGLRRSMDALGIKLPSKAVS